MMYSPTSFLLQIILLYVIEIDLTRERVKSFTSLNYLKIGKQYLARVRTMMQYMNRYCQVLRIIKPYLMMSNAGALTMVYNRLAVCKLKPYSLTRDNLLVL